MSGEKDGTEGVGAAAAMAAVATATTTPPATATPATTTPTTNLNTKRQTQGEETESTTQKEELHQGPPRSNQGRAEGRQSGGGEQHQPRRQNGSRSAKHREGLQGGASAGRVEPRGPDAHSTVPPRMPRWGSSPVTPRARAEGGDDRSIPSFQEMCGEKDGGGVDLFQRRLVWKHQGRSVGACGLVWGTGRND